MKTATTSSAFRLIAMLPFFYFVLFSQSLFAQDGPDKVIRGERPAIDLRNITAADYVPGVILLKFDPAYTEALEQNPPALLTNGRVRFNMAAIDQLNDKYGASDFIQEFRHPSLNNTFTPRHKAWGFHLWYKLEFDDATDIIAAVQEYRALNEIIIAEPEYKKMLIEGINPVPYQPDAANQNTSLLNWMPNDPSFSNQWHYHNTGQLNGTPGADIDLLQAWDIEKGNPDVIVAIVDDGIQFTHPDLADNMWSGIGYNFVNNSSNVNPGNHGTHVAGTVAAVTNNSVGVAGIAGGDGSGNGVRLMSAQVFMGGSSGGFHVAPVWSADNGAAISQNSWGYTSPNVYNQNVLDAIDYFNINGGGEAMIDGGITIFAAGNSNSSAAYYPGFYSGAFAVAGTNNQDQKAWYSNYGTWIDISAPGGETNSVSSRGVLSTVTNNNYSYYQGTSMACPHVSGVAALVLSYAYGMITPQELELILINSTDDHYAVNPNFTGQLGSGRLNAYLALLEAQNYASPVANPVVFSATTYGPNDIVLDWIQNPAEDEVVVAWAMTENFGSPDSGMIYQAGTMIPGGGIVLYTGNANTFTHSNLIPATYYYYKIWSFDSVYQYSMGRNLTALTACELFTTPFFEGFEDGSEIPFCWSQEYANNVIDWEVGIGNDGNNPPNAYQGLANAFFKAQDADDMGAVTRLVMPIMNLATHTSAELNFAFTNAKRIVQSVEYQDTLRVRYKPFVGGEWQTLATFHENTDIWIETMINIPVSSGTSYIAFEAESGRGHGICIDDVAVVGFGNVPVYTINASSGHFGSISPTGNIIVGQGGNFSFDIQAAPTYAIDTLLVDNELITEAYNEPHYVYSFDSIVEDHTIYATFKIADLMVSASINPENAGIIEGVGGYPPGTFVSLLAVENEGFTFNRWFEGTSIVSYDNPYEFDLNASRELTALFTPNMYSIQVVPEPMDGGLISGTGTHPHGTQVTLTANPSTGYAFVGWREGDEIISNDNPYSFTADTSRSLVALFDLETSVFTPEEHYFAIYPNPSSGVFTLELAAKSTVEIIDYTGRVIYGNDSDAGVSVVDISSQSKGLYFLRVSGPGGVIIRKLIIE